MPLLAAATLLAGLAHAKVRTFKDWLGDCGETQSCAWDGQALYLVGYRSMDSCRGVSTDDWIDGYRATVK